MKNEADLHKEGQLAPAVGELYSPMAQSAQLRWRNLEGVASLGSAFASKVILRQHRATCSLY
jgi:hypothetical protein